MEKTIYEKVDELIIEYGKWAKNNLLLRDNSIIAFIYSEKMGVKFDNTNSDGIVNGVMIERFATTQKEMYEVISEYTKRNIKDAHWFIPVSLWWNFFQKRKDDPHPWLVPTGKLTVGVGVSGILISEGRKLVRTYSHAAKAFKISETHFTVKLENKKVYNIVQTDNNAFRYQTIVEHHFTQFCQQVLTGIELAYKE